MSINMLIWSMKIYRLSSGSGIKKQHYPNINIERLKSKVENLLFRILTEH